jgi:hypothetical protein
VIIAGASVVSLAVGVAISCSADAHPRHRDAMEMVAGLFLILGLGLLGYMLRGLLGPLY